MLLPGTQIQYLGVQHPSETTSPGLAPSQRMSQSGSGYSAVVEIVVVDVEEVVDFVVVVVVEPITQISTRGNLGPDIETQVLSGLSSR